MHKALVVSHRLSVHLMAHALMIGFAGSLPAGNAQSKKVVGCCVDDGGSSSGNSGGGGGFDCAEASFGSPQQRLPDSCAALPRRARHSDPQVSFRTARGFLLSYAQSKNPGAEAQVHSSGALRASVSTISWGALGHTH